MRARLLPCVALAIAACNHTPKTSTRSAPPAAEFIVAAGDSAYWVTSDSAGLRVRGAPIELAQVDGRFVEVYVIDDDHSYEGADLVGQVVFRRDLRTGDSSRVFTDSIVPALARDYGRAHPHEHRLAPGEEGDDEPRLRASATLEFAGSHGPFVSYSLHTDIERAGTALWHVSRNGVFDLRSGTRASLADITGADAPGIERQRESMVRVIMDSIRARAPELASRYQFDPSSFTIATIGGAPAIAYGIPTSGTDDVDGALPMPTVTFTAPSWWGAIAATLPASAANDGQDSWSHGSYSVLVRYDIAGNGHIVLRDSASHEWPVNAISANATRIFWLDRQSFDAAARHALVRAFDEAATYGGETHIAARRPRSPFQLSSYRR